MFLVSIINNETKLIFIVKHTRSNKTAQEKIKMFLCNELLYEMPGILSSISFGRVHMRMSQKVSAVTYFIK